MINSFIRSIKSTFNYISDDIYNDYNTIKIDNMIIGGGIVGTSLAYHLSSSSNESIILIDKENIGSGATCLSAGTIYSPYGKLPSIKNTKSEVLVFSKTNLIPSYSLRKITCINLKYLHFMNRNFRELPKTYLNPL